MAERGTNESSYDEDSGCFNVLANLKNKVRKRNVKNEESYSDDSDDVSSLKLLSVHDDTCSIKTNITNVPSSDEEEFKGGILRFKSSSNSSEADVGSKENADFADFSNFSNKIKVNETQPTRPKEYIPESARNTNTADNIEKNRTQSVRPKKIIHERTKKADFILNMEESDETQSARPKEIIPESAKNADSPVNTEDNRKQSVRQKEPIPKSTIKKRERPSKSEIPKNEEKPCDENLTTKRTLKEENKALGGTGENYVNLEQESNRKCGDLTDEDNKPELKPRLSKNRPQSPGRPPRKPLTMKGDPILPLPDPNAQFYVPCNEVCGKPAILTEPKLIKEHTGPRLVPEVPSKLEKKKTERSKPVIYDPPGVFHSLYNDSKISPPDWLLKDLEEYGRTITSIRPKQLPNDKEIIISKYGIAEHKVAFSSTALPYHKEFSDYADMNSIRKYVESKHGTASDDQVSDEFCRRKKYYERYIQPRAPRNVANWFVKDRRLLFAELKADKEYPCNDCLFNYFQKLRKEFRAEEMKK